MTFEQLDRSIDADSDSDDELAEQAHMYRMMTEKGKSPTSPGSPTSGMAGLHIASPPPQPARPAAPPRPSAVSKPSSQLSVPGRAPAEYADASDDEDEDENDPFADRNAVVTPKVERNEPAW